MSAKGSAASVRRASVRRGSSRAQRRAAATSNPATSETELQVRVDRAADGLEGFGESVLQRDVGEGEFNEIGIGLDAGARLGLLDQGGAHAANGAGAGAGNMLRFCP